MFAILSGPYAPLVFAGLIAAATVAIFMALMPARPAKTVTNRLEGFVDRRDAVRAAELDRSISQRVVLPVFHSVLSRVGSVMPQRDMAKLAEKLQSAGNPGNLTVLDFVGLRILLAAVLAGLYVAALGRNESLFILLRNALVVTLVGFMLPKFWLNQQIKKRRTEIARALPDALDMLTIGVEAGLAFESALLRVGDQWDNSLSQEFRHVVSELRVGVPRNEALRHLAERNGVEDLSTFVAVLIQSNMLGVSIAQVLHAQSDQMRIKRRQYAEEQAHAATVKIVLVLVFFIFPALFVVVLGPAVPRILRMLQMAGGGG